VESSGGPHFPSLQVQKLSTPTAPRAFADLYDFLSGQADATAEEIDAVQYRFEWEGQQEG
jgi:hypothetical protein